MTVWKQGNKDMWVSVWVSTRNSVWDYVGYSVRVSWDSVEDSLWAAVWDVMGFSVRDFTEQDMKEIS